MAVYIHDLRTPALIVDIGVLNANLQAMSVVCPGEKLRPHVKAHKCTALARCQRNVGHRGFTCATLKEVEGMIDAGLGDNLLLANQTLDSVRLSRLRADILVAVDSQETIAAAVAGRVNRVLIDVNVGLNRCGCEPHQAGRLAELATRQGLHVLGVMGYEGQAAHVEDCPSQKQATAQAMALLQSAHQEVGGDIVSAGSTGTAHCNEFATEIQAGSYALMDRSYCRLDLPFRPALSVLVTVIHVAEGRMVVDGGLKCLGMDSGLPVSDAGEVVAVHDEHTIIHPHAAFRVGERIRLWPAHVDPTVAYHDEMCLVDQENVVDRWEVDLRGW